MWVWHFWFCAVVTRLTWPTSFTLHHWRLGRRLWTQPPGCTTWEKGLAQIHTSEHKHTHTQIQKYTNTQTHTNTQIDTYARACTQMHYLDLWCALKIIQTQNAGNTERAIGNHNNGEKWWLSQNECETQATKMTKDSRLHCCTNVSYILRRITMNRKLSEAG